MPYSRGKGYGPEAWLLLVGAAGVTVWVAAVLLRHAGMRP
jgi:hypothetical protein